MAHKWKEKQATQTHCETQLLHFLMHTVKQLFQLVNEVRQIMS